MTTDITQLVQACESLGFSQTDYGSELVMLGICAVIGVLIWKMFDGI